MSQVCSITNVKHKGAPVYLGERNGKDCFSSNPTDIMKWICDGYRFRFNQHRSKRCKYDKHRNLVPIGDKVTDITDKQARQEFSFLSAVPSMIIQATEKKENVEWFSAAQRRKTLKEKGLKPGRMPRFKSAKKHDQMFVCWFNGGKNAVFHRTGRKSGVVVFSGQNPSGKKPTKASPVRWKLIVRVATTQDIKPYTSVQVNWTDKKLVFTNEPGFCADPDVDTVVGIDRGGVIPLATSDGEFFAPNKDLIDKWDRKAKFHQKKMGQSVARAKKIDKQRGNKNKEYTNSVMSGNTYQHHKDAAAKYQNKIKAYKYAWIQQITTFIIRLYGVIVIEDLDVKKMTKKGKGKKGMNRSVLSAAPARIEQLLTYKAMRNGKHLVVIPAPYTSQRCNECGYTHRSNRESQALFRCRRCGYTANADYNASCNIRDLYLYVLQGTDLPAYSHKDYANGGGEVVRPTMPDGTRGNFFKFDLEADFNDPIDPASEPSVVSL